MEMTFWTRVVFCNETLHNRQAKSGMDRQRERVLVFIIALSKQQVRLILTLTSVIQYIDLPT